MNALAITLKLPTIWRRTAAATGALLLTLGVCATGTAQTTGAAQANNGARAGAYQLQDCKPTDGWIVLGGGCASYGTFRGAGTAVRGALFYSGPFENGVPHGKGTICFRSADRNDARSGTLDCAGRLSCSVEFDSGRLPGPEMVCQQAGSNNGFGRQRAGLQLTLRSPSGYFLDDGLGQGQQKGSVLYGKMTTLTTDQAQVEIRGQVAYAPLFIGDLSAVALATGELRQVSLNADSIHFDRFDGQLTIPSRKVRGGGGELRVKGVLNGRISLERADFQPYAGVVSQQGEVTRESVVEVAVSGRSYQLVFDKGLGAGRANAGRVVYYKDDAGVEFDGTAGGCVERHKRQGFADLKELRESSSGTFLGYELVPYCGKITTPSGSYAGDFRNGRPAN